jgi:hypothetical protein
VLAVLGRSGGHEVTAEDGNRTEGMWEIPHDRSTYEKDFDVVCRKAL